MRVLELIAYGLVDREIAERLHCGTKTVNTHVSSLRRRIGARNRSEAVAIGYERGWLPPRKERTAMQEPWDECDQCGADLFLDVPHECPVGGNTVLITTTEDREP
jgi:DNA-binding CsgD family transcriptional regulator